MIPGEKFGVRNVAHEPDTIAKARVDGLRHERHPARTIADDHGHRVEPLDGVKKYVNPLIGDDPPDKQHDRRPHVGPDGLYARGRHTQQPITGPIEAKRDHRALVLIARERGQFHHRGRCDHDSDRAPQCELQQRFIKQLVLQRRTDDLAVEPDDQRHPRTSDRIRQQRHRVGLMQHDHIGVGARQPQRKHRRHGDRPECRDARDAAHGDVVHRLVNRSMFFVQNQRLRVDGRTFATAQRLDDGFDTTAIRCVILPEVQDAKRAHCDAARRRGTARI